MGGRLSRFTVFWEQSLNAPSFLVNILKGYRIPFRGFPKLQIPNLSRVQHFSPEKMALIDEEVSSMLLKGAIREVTAPSLSFVSNIFTVPKKDGGNRPVINLKPLNSQFLSPPHFKMDTVKDVAGLLRPGDFGASIDLKDAYFHIPVHPSLRKYLRFIWRGKLYEFLVLPFGLSTAPFIFTKVTRPVAAFLRAQGIRLIFYLDDILILGQTFQECLLNVEKAVSLLQMAGFLINWKKSSLVPTQRFLFLGLWWDTVLESISLEERKLTSLQSQASRLLSLKSPNCRSLMRMLGLMTAATPAVPLIRLHCRPLQICLNKFYKTCSDLLLPLSLTQEASMELNWVTNLTMSQCQAPIWAPKLEDADLRVASDAYDQGWGLYFEGQMVSGTWAALARLHINVKEITALLIFLRDYFPSIHRPVRTILWETDSTTALAYISKEGGTHSAPLLKVAQEILFLARDLQVSILPVFVPSEANLHADFASRFKSLPDLHLLPSIFDKICDLWGVPVIDLFASPKSTQLPRFMAWGNAPSAEAFDALSLPWTFDMAYLFPPLPLVSRVVEKIAQSSGLFILVCPFWPAQSWHPKLLSLRVLDVRRLPYLSNLVVDLVSKKPPRLLPSLHLVVWKILGGRTNLKASLPKPSISSALDGANLPMPDMNAHGRLSPTFCAPTTFQSIPSL